MPSYRFWIGAGAALALLLLALPACRVTDVPLWQPEPAADDAYKVDHVRDIVYREGKDAHRHKHRLDLFLPHGLKDFPVVFLVHGGAWMAGDNRCCGLYTSVAEFLATQGFGVVVPNYRLSPRVKHPAHIQDVAHAFAWMHAHIREHGGDVNRILLVGHSAGGHLVSLLTTDESYLKAEGLDAGWIKGVVSISGVYRIPEGKMKVLLDGEQSASFRLDQILPLRKPSTHGRMGPALTPGLPLELNVFGLAFGDNPEVRAQASPLTHVRAGLPPFLLLSAENDLPSLGKMARDFERALRDQGCVSQRILIRDRNHNSVMFRMIEADDAAAQHVLAFLRANS